MNLVYDFCKKYDFPEESLKYLSNCYDILQDNNVAYQLFKRMVARYESDIEFDISQSLSDIHDLSPITGIHKYTLELLYFIALTPHLKIIYQERDLPEDIYDDSVLDLKWKAFECKDVYGVWGMFVGWWTIQFFRLKRFGIGRFDYNLVELPYDAYIDGKNIKKGEIYISVHIPSSGPLIYEECKSSYKKAAVFFSERYGIKTIIFGCRSWLLSPNNRKILPQNSRILKFSSDYTIIETTKCPDNPDLWRIFGIMNMPEKVDDLPQDNSFRKMFANWIKNGGTIDTAFGLFIYDN